jgi:hypothetical protein
VFAVTEMQFGGDTIEGGSDEKTSIVLFEDLSVAVVVEIVIQYCHFCGFTLAKKASNRDVIRQSMKILRSIFVPPNVIT